MSRLLRDLRKYPESEKTYSFGAVHHLIFKRDGNLDLEPLEQYLKELGHQDVEMKMVHSEIEDVFIDLMEKVA